MDDKKIAFIFGSDKEEVGIYDGGIEKVGNIKDGAIHATCLVEYGREKYPEASIFQKLNNRYMPEAISYFFINPYNHAVFLNTTKYYDDGKISKHGKTGLLLLPNQLTAKQEEAIGKFLDEVQDYSVSITYNLSIIAGFVEGSEILSLSKTDTKGAFQAYLEKTKEKNKSL